MGECRAGSSLRLNHPLLMINTPKPGSQYAMGMKEERGSHLALTVLTNCTTILYWNNPHFNLVVPITVYHLPVNYSAVFSLSCVQELLCPPARVQCCGLVPGIRGCTGAATTTTCGRTIKCATYLEC